MSKPTVTRLFIGAVLLVVVGLLVAFAAIVAALAGGAITLGGPAVVNVNGDAFAGVLVWLGIASLAIAAGSLAAIASWIGALLNTFQLEDKTWFVVLLVLGVFSLGWVAMAAYVFAGPDAMSPGMAPSGVVPTPDT
jgi:hypothetical protein